MAEADASAAPVAGTTAPAASTTAAPAAAAPAATTAAVVAPVVPVTTPVVPNAAAAPAAASATAEVKTGAPEAYADFTAPEGVTIAPKMLDVLKDTAKSLNLSQADAQAMVDKMLPGMQADNHTAVQTLAKQVSDGWLTAAKADATLGGEQFDANLAVAKRTLTTFGTPELTKFLDASGLGNHPELIRWAHKIGSLLGPDGKFVNAQTPNNGPRAPEDVLWPAKAA